MNLASSSYLLITINYVDIDGSSIKINIFLKDVDFNINNF